MTTNPSPANPSSSPPPATNPPAANPPATNPVATKPAAAPLPAAKPPATKPTATPAPTAPRRPATQLPATTFVQGILLSVLIIVLYTELVVPGISMTTPSHYDVYRYSDMLDAVPFSQLYRGPRPMSWLAIKLGGALPWSAMMWTFSLVGIAATLAPIVVYSVLLKRTIPIAGMILWSLLLVSCPAIYLGLVHGLGFHLALLFASISVYWYAIYFQQKSSYHLIIACLFSLAGFLSKETFGPMQMAVVAYVGYLYRARPREIGAALVTVVLALVASWLHFRFVASGAASSVIDFNPFSVVRAVAGFAAMALTPPILLGIAGLGAYLATRREWSGLTVCAAGAVISLLSLLPSAMFAKQGGGNNEMALVPLMAGLVVAQMDYWGLFAQLKAAMPLALCGLAASGIVWGEYALTKHYSSQMGSARFDQNVIRSLHVLGEEVRSADKVAVLGLQKIGVVQPWTPFTHGAYLRETLAFPATTFAIVSPAYAKAPGAAHAADRTRAFVPDLETARKGGVDLVMAFGADGAVRRVITDRGQINRLMAAKDLDPTRLYDPQYWTNKVEPLLVEPDPKPQAEINALPVDPRIQNIATFFRGLPPATRVIGVDDAEGDGPSPLRRWLPVHYESVTEYGRKNPDVIASAESLQKHLSKADDVAYVIAPKTTETPLGRLVRSALDKSVAMGFAKVSHQDQHFQAWALLKTHMETISLTGGGTASIVYDPKQLCKKPLLGVVTVIWDNTKAEAPGGVAIEVRASENQKARLFYNGGVSGTATTGPWMPINGEFIFRKGPDGEIIGRMILKQDCPDAK